LLEAASLVQPFRNQQISQPWPVTESKTVQNTFSAIRIWSIHVSSNAVLETVRRYRAIASLYRQTAGFRPVQRASLLSQAHEWETRALETLETYYADHNLSQEPKSAISSYFGAQSEMMVAAR
jgi:hypothetical protein